MSAEQTKTAEAKGTRTLTGRVVSTRTLRLELRTGAGHVMVERSAS